MTRNLSISDEEFENEYGAEGMRRAKLKRKQRERITAEAKQTKANETQANAAEFSALGFAYMISATRARRRSKPAQEVDDSDVVDGEIVREWRT